MTDYKKLSEIISSSRQNLKNALEGKVSSSELLQQSILQQQIAKETAKKDLEERKRLKEEERKALEEIKEEEPVAVNINPPGAVDGRKRKRGRPRGSKNKKKKNIDEMTDTELLTELEEDYANFSFKRGDETKQDPIPFSKPKRKSNKGKNKNKDNSFTRKLIEDARQSLYQDGEGVKKKSNKKIQPGSKKLKIDKKRQNLIVELNLLMGSIRSGSSNKKMNERVKTILKQLITE